MLGFRAKGQLEVPHGIAPVREKGEQLIHLEPLGLPLDLYALVACNLAYFVASRQVQGFRHGARRSLIMGMGQDCLKTWPISRYPGKRAR